MSPDSQMDPDGLVAADSLIDTHCHLDQLGHSQAVLASAAAAGVDRLVAVSENPASMESVLDLRASYPDTVIAGLGLHPAWVVLQTEEHAEAAIAHLGTVLASADLLGEVGLDHKWAQSAEQKRYQEEILDRQLAMAGRLHKPINLHSRRSQRQVMEKAVQFRRDTGLNAQLHWFTQSKKLVRICNSEGLYVSVGPTVIDDSHTQAVACEIADDLLLLESDAPVPVGGRAGHPRRVREVAETLARLKSCTVSEIAHLTTGNFARFINTSDLELPGSDPSF